MLDDLGKDHDPSDDIRKELDTDPQLKGRITVNVAWTFWSSSRNDSGLSPHSGKQGSDLPGRSRWAEQIALHLSAAFGS